MTVVTPGATFTVKFIPKDNAQSLGNCLLVNKNTSVSTTLVLDTDIEYFDGDYYVEADITHTTKEGEFYKYTVYNDLNEVSYVGGVYVTAKTSINEGDYIENTTTNEYITR